jgi:peroxiredoxin
VARGILLIGVLVGASAWAAGGLRFTLRDTHNAIHRSEEWRDKKAVVLFFTTTDCPVGNSYVPEMNRIRNDYENRGVAFYAVQGDTTISEPEVEKYSREFGFSFPVLFDPRQVLVKMTGATTMPEAAVLSVSGTLLYLGRIDNRVEDFTRRRPEATKLDLRDAIDAVLAGRPVANPRTKAFGCAINRVE